MADENTNSSAQPQQAAAQPQMRVLGQFIRDMSFENIMAQKGAPADVQPDVQVQVNLDAKKRSGDNQYETAIKLNVTSKNKGGDQKKMVCVNPILGTEVADTTDHFPDG